MLFRSCRIFSTLVALTAVGSALVVGCAGESGEGDYVGTDPFAVATGAPSASTTDGAAVPSAPPVGAGGTAALPPSTGTGGLSPVGMLPPPTPTPTGTAAVPPPLLPNPPAPATFNLAAAVAGKTASVDTDKNGTPDGIAVDTDADGMMDATAVDANGDMKFDTLKRDLDRDGTFEAVVEMPPPPLVADATPCNFEFTVTTANYGGKYKENNSGAAWISDEAGMFVRTLKAWSKIREKHVQKWVVASNKDRTNAISSATLKTQGQHVLTWDCTGKDGTTVVPFGKYTMHFEFTSVNGAGPYLPVMFERGAMPVEVVVPTPMMPANDAKGFPMGATLKYSPSK